VPTHVDRRDVARRAGAARDSGSAQAISASGSGEGVEPTPSEGGRAAAPA
jgi:hypothetical protein